MTNRPKHKGLKQRGDIYLNKSHHMTYSQSSSTVSAPNNHQPCHHDHQASAAQTNAIISLPGPERCDWGANTVI